MRKGEDDANRPPGTDHCEEVGAVHERLALEASRRCDTGRHLSRPHIQAACFLSKQKQGQQQ